MIAKSICAEHIVSEFKSLGSYWLCGFGNLLNSVPWFLHLVKWERELSLLHIASVRIQ